MQDNRDEYQSPSEQLRAIGATLEERDAPVSLGKIIDRLGEAGIGMTLIILTVPALIPIPGPFGFFFGTLIALVAFQLMFGAGRLWLPQIIRKRTLPPKPG